MPHLDTANKILNKLSFDILLCYTIHSVIFFFIIHPCDPTVVIWYLIYLCDMDVVITHLISHSFSLSCHTVIEGYVRFGV